MNDEALIHFHRGTAISPGVHMGARGSDAPAFIASAAQRYDLESPGRSAAGFCATCFDLVADLRPAPPSGWNRWRFTEWDTWFGRLHGVFLVDLEALTVTQFALYRTSPRRVHCDFSQLPGRLALA